MTLAQRAGLALRVARGQAEQQAAIDAWLHTQPADANGAPHLAVIAEGAFFELTVPQNVTVARLAAGCVCCVGLLPMQVTLTRLLRTVRPRALLLLLADAAHFERVRSMVARGQLGVSLEGSA
jgi:hypothetical protein